MPPDPIVLYYTFNPAAPPPERPSAWDIEVKMEDTTVKNRMTAIVQSSKESAQDLSKLDDEVGSSPCSADLISRTATFFRFHSLRSHCTIHTQSVCFCKVLQMTRQNSSRRGWNRSHGIWRVFLEVGRARVPRSVQRSSGGATSSAFLGLKRLSRYKKACVWHQSHESKWVPDRVMLCVFPVLLIVLCFVLCWSCIFVLGCCARSAKHDKKKMMKWAHAGCTRLSMIDRRDPDKADLSTNKIRPPTFNCGCISLQHRHGQ